MTDINFEEYLTDEERKEIVASAFREKCRGFFKQDDDNLLANAAHLIVLQKVNEMHNGNADELIKDNVVRVIKNLSEYHVFHKQSYPYSNGNGAGYAALVRAVESNESLLACKVASIINELDNYDVGQILKDVLEKILTGEKK